MDANAIFQQIDTDRSGSIEDHELLTHLLQAGQDDESISALFRALDTNEDGCISRAEWIQGFELYARARQSGDRSQEEARLAAVRAAWPTQEHQAEALAKAAAAQEKTAAAADAATAEEKAKEGSAYTHGGLRPLEPLLASIDLIDVAYLIALGEAGGVVPRWQDVPAAARINAASVWRLRCFDGGMPILVLSYPWLDRHHPDKHGATLRRILPILRACREWVLEWGGVHCTFGVFWDYMSLPQGAWVCGRNGETRFEDDRTEAEGARFKQGLATMAACAAPRAPAPAPLLTPRASPPQLLRAPKHFRAERAHADPGRRLREQAPVRDARVRRATPPPPRRVSPGAPLPRASGGATSSCAPPASSRTPAASGT